MSITLNQNDSKVRIGKIEIGKFKLDVPGRKVEIKLRTRVSPRVELEITNKMKDLFAQNEIGELSIGIKYRL